MKLRPYQEEAVEAALQAINAGLSPLLVMPTASGKTVVFGHIIKRLSGEGRAMVVAHREELLDQAQDKIEAVTGVRPDLEMAEARADLGMFQSPIVTASVQTLNSGHNGAKRMARFDPSEFRLLVIDEAHHAVADTYKAVIEHFRQNPGVAVMGVTATPDRHDEKVLGQIFDICAYEYGIRNAIEEGWLVRIRQRFLGVEVDLSGVRYTLGDLNGADLREALARGSTLEYIVSDSVQYAEDRRTLVFSDSIENAEQLTIHYNRWRAGCAQLVTGKTPKDERRTLMADYRAGRFQYLVNVGVATEGFDVPEIACIVMARPTCSRSLYAQMLGRGTRVLGGLVDGIDDAQARCHAVAQSAKPDLLVLDLVGNSAKHKLVHAADVLGGNYREDYINRATELIAGNGADRDVLETLDEAEQLCNAQLEAAAKQQEALKLRRKSRVREVDPFAVFEIARQEPRGWDVGREITAEQRQKLDKWRIDLPADADYTVAQQLIDTFRSRCRRGLCTYRQKLILDRKGYAAETATMSFERAHKLIDEIAAREGWGKR